MGGYSYVNVLNDAILTLDFVDVSLEEFDEKTYFAPLQSRNANEDENAYSVVVKENGWYDLMLTNYDNIQVFINEIESKDPFIYTEEYTKQEGNGRLLLYLHRGYNKVTLSDNAELVSVTVDPKAFESNSNVITPTDMKVFNGATIEDDENTSSGKRIGWIASDKGSYATFNAKAPKAGYYNFTIEYANNEEGGYHDYNVDLVERYITFTVNGENRGNYFFRSTYSWETYKTKTVVLYLDEGNNEIKLSNDGSYSFNNKVTYAPNIGDIQVNPF